jgi:hypothetical protein
METQRDKNQTFTVINGVDVFRLDKLDEGIQAECTARYGAGLLNILCLYMAADTFATHLNVMKAVVQDFIDAEKRG